MEIKSDKLNESNKTNTKPITYPLTYDNIYHEPEEGYEQTWRDSAKKTWLNPEPHEQGLNDLTFAMGGIGSLPPVQSVAKAAAPWLGEYALFTGIEHAYQKSKESDEGTYDTLWNRLHSMVPPSHLTPEEADEWKKTFMQNHVYSNLSPRAGNITGGLLSMANNFQKNPVFGKSPYTMPFWFAGDIANELGSVMETGNSRQADVYR